MQRPLKSRSWLGAATGAALVDGALLAGRSGGAAPAPAAPGRRPATDGGAPAATAAPGYVVVDLPGIRRALRGSRGHAVVVHFWATWCLPCLEELPIIEKFARDVKAQGVEVMSLSLDDPEKSGARVSKVLAEVAPSLTRTIARIEDPDTFIGHFGDWEGSIPAVFGYDAEGQLRDQIVGEADRRALDDLVRRVLKSRARPPRQ